jgi:hypothetical protein
MFNANIAVIYLIFTVVGICFSWFSSSKTGASTYDSNIYRVMGHYGAGKIVVPPGSAVPLVNVTPMGTGLALVGAMLISALFHFIYAIDCRRLYTLSLIDRCNAMRWAQFGITHTILAMIVAQMLGTVTYDFLMASLMFLPCLGIMGYFEDRSFPCSPTMGNVSVLGAALLLLAYWIVVVTNFVYRYTDAAVPPPAYMWIALVGLFLYDILFFIMPWIQYRQRLGYFTVEVVQNIALVAISGIILVCVCWALADQQT